MQFQHLTDVSPCGVSALLRLSSDKHAANGLRCCSQLNANQPRFTSHSRLAHTCVAALQASLPSSFRDYTNVPFVLDPVFITYDDPEVFRAKFPVHAAALAGNALELRARLFPRVVGSERSGSSCDPSASMRPMSAAARRNRGIVDARDAVGWTALHHAAARGHLHCVAALVNGTQHHPSNFTTGFA
jgi:hypothetical protein